MQMTSGRQLWTRPVNNRFLQGEFYTVCEDLKADNGKFFSCFRNFLPDSQMVSNKLKKERKKEN